MVVPLGECLHSMNSVYLHATFLPPSLLLSYMKTLLFHLSHFELNFLSLVTSPMSSIKLRNLEILP